MSYVTLNPSGPRTPDKEQVLVFPASLVAFGGGFEDGPLVADPNEVRDYLEEIIQRENLTYIDRDHAEQDPEWLQLIPYTVLLRGREVFRYRRTRKGGESRLHDKWSVGVGGHINPCDGEWGVGDTPYWNAFYRELSEEVSLNNVDVRNLDNKVVGLLYDPSNDVGKVHFGVVHFLTLPFEAGLEFLDPALADGYFQHILDLKASAADAAFENWSRLVIDNLL